MAAVCQGGGTRLMSWGRELELNPSTCAHPRHDARGKAAFYRRYKQLIFKVGPTRLLHCIYAFHGLLRPSWNRFWTCAAWPLVTKPQRLHLGSFGTASLRLCTCAVARPPVYSNPCMPHIYVQSVCKPCQCKSVHAKCKSEHGKCKSVAQMNVRWR